MRWLLACALTLPALWLLGCSTIGDPGGVPDGLPHGGTGEFRLLDSEELAIIGSLPGRALVTRDAVESAMPVGGSLFYATARLVDEPPALPEDQPPGEIFWPAFEPRRIHRATLREEGFGGYAVGDAVLSANEDWEGGEVYDPWVTVDAEGVARLYYAAAGGIGLAEARSVEGPYARIGDGLILPGDGAPLRRPSVIRGADGAWWMYYDSGAQVHAARSLDGREFEPMGPITLTGEDEGEGREVSIGRAGAVRIATRAGRVLVRLYLESAREDLLEVGTAHVIYVAASADGLSFERYPRPVMPQTDMRFPAPQVVDDRVTLLYGNLPFFGGPYLTRAVVASVGPAGHRFAPAEP